MNKRNIELKENKKSLNSIPGHETGILLPQELVEELLELLTIPKKFNYNTNEIVCDWDKVTKISANLLSALREQGMKTDD